MSWYVDAQTGGLMPQVHWNHGGRPCTGDEHEWEYEETTGVERYDWDRTVRDVAIKALDAVLAR